jgi:hypothetical protein
MINRLFLILILILGSQVYAQNSDCKVTLPGISGSYSGNCKNGLAQGKGIAKGIDSYEGQFVKGKPDGKGTYKWSDGTSYVGQWKDGLRDGMGKMIYKDSTVTGYWKEDVYKGSQLIPSYRILNSMSVARSTISKTSGFGNGVKIRILLGGDDNANLDGFALTTSSGTEYHSGYTYGIENALLPLEVKVMYRTWNKLHTTQNDVRFEFVINDPGIWNVVISN